MSIQFFVFTINDIIDVTEMHIFLAIQYTVVSLQSFFVSKC